jgi:hypothetical protein
MHQAMDSAESFERIRSMDTADGHQKLIRSQWQEFAAFAWQRYLSEGRGAVIIDLWRAARNDSTLIPTYYVADGSDLLVGRGGWPNEDVAEMVRQYDPEQDVIFVVVRLDEGFFYYNVSDELTPRAAYEAGQID